jgi:DNA replication and repair protein RecF
LKLLELDFIKLNTGKTPIFLIDDFSSELDEIHIKILLDKISNIQTIITSISEIEAIK